jgi:hypothetical protein
MSLVTIVLALIVVGILLWLVQKYIPMDPTMYRILLAVVVIVVVLWLLQTFGILGSINQIRVK